MQKDKEKYRDIDEDAILKGMSPEELEQLECELQEMDPENAMLPAGMRQRDQTKKNPTGPFNREALLGHLEKEAGAGGQGGLSALHQGEERKGVHPEAGEEGDPAG
ncbi:tropomodulin-4 isoform X1 [Acipenser oxyrinchus oxyrinchus]|uniref:Tropomodulin-4 isoform X1 n=1 Tax=Acipenser oxyrinchus oxyrinchus TaxID=40147 RepID=A0AAD8FPB2_ACIOX|nr:tropomodulin-4 isoform X1 [Acipenser oxyrinchus oxyrinchus]